MTLALLAFLACTGDPLGAFTDCEDPACREAAIVAAWETDPDAVRAQLVAMEDELETLSLVDELSQVASAEMQALCKDLQLSSYGRSRCRRMIERPHLSAEQRFDPAALRANAARKRPGGGPAGRDLPLPDLGEPAWLALDAGALQAHLDGCEGRLCAGARSIERAASGDIEGAGAVCLASDPERGKGYAECLFRAAEAAVKERGVDALAGGLTLCSASDYATFCAGHLVQLSVPPAPPADATGRAEIDAAIQAARVVRAAAKEGWHGDLYVDYFWTLWVEGAYRGAREVTGTLLDHLPIEAHPHVRFSAAMRQLKRQDLSRFDLDTATESVAIQLAIRQEIPDAAPRSSEIVPLTTRGFWDLDLGEERKIPAIYCTNGTRRPTSSDAEIDLQLAVLEAAARAQRPPSAGRFLAMVGSDDDELIRWTAARLGAAMDPAAAQALSADTDEASGLVKGRLKPVGKKWPGG